MIKRCVICKLPKIVSEFNKASRRKDGLQPHCRTCNSLRSRAYYARNKKKHVKVVLALKKRRVKEHQVRVREYLQTHSCVDCGEADIDVLEFDHVRGKKFSEISRLVGDGYAWKTIKTEIEKCEVRCANHHRKATLQRLRGKFISDPDMQY